ncbi:ferredoxin [Gordonia polyisoprenivorans]|uniref:ferredoxin n=1 Tax=Gordonia polyisoprenivorans TaxID=84595 RepID=UPI001AD62267|nr:ferredoxin [Gordonia polyisoprenivorans]QTI70892.1 ferredoxin [Gordonia polyisoprenivorans]
MAVTATHSPILVVDRSACAGHGLCYGAAPELIDCDDQGDPIVPDRALTEAEVVQAAEAVGLCPERALTLTDGVNPTDNSPEEQS